ncbi:type II toxin-antitoxin system RelE/ParE family toxin [Bradyrhizobium liaoningense]|uniref:type II toxin-antitoxin system RelE/ParE family toxin n=1 Tax=Bradyrhizobium liaoningense TaxID=43992 RepID=UPI001BAA8CA2|nr:type II toxin-antitoxin system RelE/ParE family toxin [Bradyrhizobium liaoningense]MBR0709315.1 type II toxin-antitoxin system RelE/ParE family toxin [Bradyrhizobium liaoningense]
MFEVQKTDEFDQWLAALRDQRAVAKIASRIERLAMGNAGDVKAVGAGVSELRVDYGPGYRVYYKQVGNRIVLILCGGDKSTQDRDIRHAKAIASQL